MADLDSFKITQCVSNVFWGNQSSLNRASLHYVNQEYRYVQIWVLDIKCTTGEQVFHVIVAIVFSMTGMLYDQSTSRAGTISFIFLIHLWLSQTLECRLTNHSAAKNELPQRSETFSQRFIDFQHRSLIFWSQQAITVVVLSKIWLNVGMGHL